MRQPIAPEVADDGFTLAELLAALAVIAVGLYGLATVFAGATRATGTTGGRTQAVAVATGELERLRATSYELLGTVGGDPSGTEPVSGTAELGGRTFTVTRAVDWVVVGPESTDRYKRVTVTVAWQEVGTTQTVEQALDVYPGGLGPSDGTTSTTVATGSPGRPRNVRVRPTSGAETTSLDLSWGLSGTLPTSWQIERSSDAGITWASVSTLAGTMRTLRVSSLSPGTQYRFRIRGVSGSLTSIWVYKNGRTEGTSGSGSCTLQATTVVPLVVARSSGGHLAQAVTVEVTTTGSCTGSYQWQVVPTPEDSSSTALTGTMSISTGVIQGTIPSASGVWSAGEKLVEVYQTGVSEPVGQATLTVSP